MLSAVLGAIAVVLLFVFVVVLVQGGLWQPWALAAFVCALVAAALSRDLW